MANRPISVLRKEFIEISQKIDNNETVFLTKKSEQEKTFILSTNSYKKMHEHYEIYDMLQKSQHEYETISNHVDAEDVFAEMFEIVNESE